MNLVDSSGKPLDGSRKYTIHFAKSDLPPVNALVREEATLLPAQ